MSCLFDCVLISFFEGRSHYGVLQWDVQLSTLDTNSFARLPDYRDFFRQLNDVDGLGTSRFVYYVSRLTSLNNPYPLDLCSWLLSSSLGFSCLSILCSWGAILLYSTRHQHNWSVRCRMLTFLTHSLIFSQSSLSLYSQTHFHNESVFYFSIPCFLCSPCTEVQPVEPSSLLSLSDRRVWSGYQLFYCWYSHCFLLFLYF